MKKKSKKQLQLDILKATLGGVSSEGKPDARSLSKEKQKQLRDISVTENHGEKSKEMPIIKTSGGDRKVYGVEDRVKDMKELDKKKEHHGLWSDYEELKEDEQLDEVSNKLAFRTNDLRKQKFNTATDNVAATMADTSRNSMIQNNTIRDPESAPVDIADAAILKAQGQANTSISLDKVGKAIQKLSRNNMLTRQTVSRNIVNNLPKIEESDNMDSYVKQFEKEHPMAKKLPGSGSKSSMFAGPKQMHSHDQVEYSYDEGRSRHTIVHNLKTGEIEHTVHTPAMYKNNKLLKIGSVTTKKVKAAVDESRYAQNDNSNVDLFALAQSKEMLAQNKIAQRNMELESKFAQQQAEKAAAKAAQDKQIKKPLSIGSRFKSLIKKSPIGEVVKITDTTADVSKFRVNNGKVQQAIAAQVGTIKTDTPIANVEKMELPAKQMSVGKTTNMLNSASTKIKSLVPVKENTMKSFKEYLEEAKIKHPNQQKLDVHEPEKDELTAKDFEMLRKTKKNEEIEEISEAPIIPGLAMADKVKKIARGMFAKKEDLAADIATAPKAPITAADMKKMSKERGEKVKRALSSRGPVPVGLAVKSTVTPKEGKGLLSGGKYTPSQDTTSTVRKTKFEEVEQNEIVEMTDAQMAKRERYVKAMKHKMSDFEKKYGDRAKEVMYATATKMAMKEAVVVNVEEGNMPVKPGSYKVNFLSRDKDTKITGVDKKQDKILGDRDEQGNIIVKTNKGSVKLPKAHIPGTTKNDIIEPKTIPKNINDL